CVTTARPGTLAASDRGVGGNEASNASFRLSRRRRSRWLDSQNRLEQCAGESSRRRRQAVSVHSSRQSLLFWFVATAFVASCRRIPDRSLCQNQRGSWFAQPHRVRRRRPRRRQPSRGWTPGLEQLGAATPFVRSAGRL